MRDTMSGALQATAYILKVCQKTKSRRSRITFMTAEAAGLLKEYLGARINEPDSKIFPTGGEAVYHRIMRTVKSAGLKTKMDTESRRYAIHPHSLRKFFFSNCLSAGLDRGLTEGFMGHNFALDSSYLRMSDEELKEQYMKAADRLTFNGGANQATVQSMQERIRELEAKLTNEPEMIDRIIASPRFTKIVLELMKHAPEPEEAKKRKA